MTATILFSFPTALPFLPTDYLCAGCLFFVGLGYGWLAVHLVCEVAYKGDYATVVSILAVSLLAKTILTSLINLHGSPVAQVAAAIASPVIAFAAVRAGQRLLDRSPQTLDLAELPKVHEPDRRVLLVLLVLLPVLRALVRVLSKMGFWGSGYEVENILNGLGFLVVIALVLFFARVTLVEQGDDYITRFLPPFMVISAGSSLLDPQVAHSSGSRRGRATCSPPSSSCSRSCSTGRSSRCPSAASTCIRTAWWASATPCMARSPSPTRCRTRWSSASLIVLAMYFFIVVMMLLFRRAAAALRRPVRKRFRPVIAPSSEEDRLQALAARYGLSPRETEVFALLAQGRNRTYIQNTLFLAEGTVKTHTSRIYQKLGETTGRT